MSVPSYPINYDDQTGILQFGAHQVPLHKAKSFWIRYVEGNMKQSKVTVWSGSEKGKDYKAALRFYPQTEEKMKELVQILLTKTDAAFLSQIAGFRFSDNERALRVEFFDGADRNSFCRFVAPGSVQNDEEGAVFTPSQELDREKQKERIKQLAEQIKSRCHQTPKYASGPFIDLEQEERERYLLASKQSAQLREEEYERVSKQFLRRKICISSSSIWSWADSNLKDRIPFYDIFWLYPDRVTHSYFVPGQEGEAALRNTDAIFSLIKAPQKDDQKTDS